MLLIIFSKRISEIDITGTRTLLQIDESLKKQGKKLLLSHIWEGTLLWDSLGYAGALEKIGVKNIFPDLDRALEYAEDQVLCGGLCQISDREYDVAEMDILAGFSDAELKIVKSGLSPEYYQNGDLIIREGDRNWDQLMLLRGMVSVKMGLDNSLREHRLYAIIMS